MAVGLAAGIPCAEASTVYSDRAEWEAAVVGETTIDFEGIVGFAGFKDVSAGLTLSGVTFTPTPRSGLFVVDPFLNPEHYAWGSGAVLSAGFTVPTGIDVALPPGTKAWGVDLMTFGPYAASVTIVVGTDVFTAATLDFPSRAFFGLVSDEAIERVRLFSTLDADGGLNLDDFSYVAATVPEPASVGLLGAAGLLALAASRRRRP